MADGLNLPDSVFEKLLKERIIFLGSEVNDEVANLLCAQMLLLAAEDPTADISMYINSPGGSVTAGMAIYDTMQFISCDVATYAMGMAASMGQFLLTAGASGKRYALPHKDYYEWCGPNAGGYVLDARDWPTQHILHLVKTVQYTKEGTC